MRHKREREAQASNWSVSGSLWSRRSLCFANIWPACNFDWSQFHCFIVHIIALHCIDIINVIVITTPHCTVSESQAPLSCISSWNTWPCNNNVYKDPAPWSCVPVFLPRETVQHRYVCMCKPISLILHAGMGSFLHRLDCISNVHHRCLALGLQPLQIDFSTSVVDHLLAHVC